MNVLLILTALMVQGCMARAQQAADGDADPALAGYAARVAGHGKRTPIVNADLPSACAENEILWHRDLATDLCAPLCSSDVDCIEGIERCAAIPLPGSDLKGRVFVDDEPEVMARVAAGIEDGRAEEGASPSAIAVCDPFFDIEGALSADLVEVVPLVADER